MNLWPFGSSMENMLSFFLHRLPQFPHWLLLFLVAAVFYVFLKIQSSTDLGQPFVGFFFFYLENFEQFLLPFL